MVAEVPAGIEPIADLSVGYETKVTIEKLLGWEEGYRGKPYHCSEGYVTYGIGHRLSAIKGDDISKYSDLWISVGDAEKLLSNDLSKVYSLIKYSKFGSLYDSLSNDRQIVIESMVYQMGILGVEGFTNMWSCIADGDYRGASLEMLDSKWSGQTPERAKRHAEVMEFDDLKHTYGAFLS